MDIQVRAGDGCAVMGVSGRLDAVTAPAAEAEINKALEAASPRLVINLAGVDYISSAGLRILLAALKKATQTNGRIALCGLQAPVREVFEISGLLSVFPLAADETAAQALAKG